MGHRKIGEPFSPVGLVLGKSSKSGFQWNQFLDFEGGNIVTPPIGAWDTTGGIGVVTILTTAAAAIRGNFGSQIGIPDTDPRFGSITGPTNETTITLDFLFDPNGIAMAPGDRFLMVQAIGSGPGGFAFRYELDNAGGILGLSIGYVTDAGAAVNLPKIPIPDDGIQVCAEWKAASQVGANDGILRAIVNGTQEEIITIDNDQHDVDTIFMGAIAFVDVGTTGTIFFDNVRWANRFR